MWAIRFWKRWVGSMCDENSKIFWSLQKSRSGVLIILPYQDSHKLKLFASLLGDRDNREVINAQARVSICAKQKITVEMPHSDSDCRIYGNAIDLIWKDHTLYTGCSHLGRLVLFLVNNIIGGAYCHNARWACAFMFLLYSCHASIIARWPHLNWNWLHNGTCLSF